MTTVDKQESSPQHDAPSYGVWMFPLGLIADAPYEALRKMLQQIASAGGPEVRWGIVQLQAKHIQKGKVSRLIALLVEMDMRVLESVRSCMAALGAMYAADPGSHRGVYYEKKIEPMLVGFVVAAARTREIESAELWLCIADESIIVQTLDTKTGKVLPRKVGAE